MIGDRKLSNEELVVQCKRGNSQALKQLYDQYAPQMLGVCMRYARSREVAQDLVHDGFLKVFESIKNLREHENLTSWIVKIMVNTAINYLKREVRHFEDVSELLDVSITDEANDYDHLDVEYLLKVIQSLPDKYRVVFNMHEVEGYTFEEIANELKIEQSSVRSILCRARQKIIENLKTNEQ